MDERVNKLEEAQGKIQEAINLITEAVHGTDDEDSAKAYIISHLENWAHGINPHDETIPRLIDNAFYGNEDQAPEDGSQYGRNY